MTRTEFFLDTLAIVYVDDILLASSTEEAEDRVAKALNKVVPTKTTGLITPSDGGSLTFIGHRKGDHSRKRRE